MSPGLEDRADHGAQLAVLHDGRCWSDHWSLGFEGEGFLAEVLGEVGEDLGDDLLVLRSACADKLNFVERRMEHALQSGDEAARHLCHVVMEYTGELAEMSLKWALRSTLEVYSTWRAARM